MLNAVAKCNTTVIIRLSLGLKLVVNIPFKISKCPLLLTGKNSVNPWTIPKTKAIKKSKKIYCFFIIPKRTKPYPDITKNGARVILLNEKISSSLKTLGSCEPPPDIKTNPNRTITQPIIMKI